MWISTFKQQTWRNILKRHINRIMCRKYRKDPWKCNGEWFLSCFQRLASFFRYIIIFAASQDTVLQPSHLQTQRHQRSQILLTKVPKFTGNTANKLNIRYYLLYTTFYFYKYAKYYCVHSIKSLLLRVPVNPKHFATVALNNNSCTEILFQILHPHSNVTRATWTCLK